MACSRGSVNTARGFSFIAATMPVFARCGEIAIPEPSGTGAALPEIPGTEVENVHAHADLVAWAQAQFVDDAEIGNLVVAH